MQTAVPLVPEPSPFKVEIASEKLKRYKWPNTDQILAELIQAGGGILHSGIHKLRNSIWAKEELPQQWKESIIVPDYKKGDKIVYSNSRGISLLPTTYNILSSILSSNLSPYVDEIIGDYQCGLNSNRSTTDQIFCIHKILEMKWEHISYIHILRRPMTQWEEK
jgi:hypothetical protein